MSIIDHTGVNVTDYAKSKPFYEKAFAPLGITLIREYGPMGGFGRDGKAEFWVVQGKGEFQSVEQLKIITPVHTAFIARSREEVDAFTPRPTRRAAATTASRVRARSITRVTTALLSSILTDTTSKPSFTSSDLPLSRVD